MAITFVSPAGALAGNATTVTLPVVAPTCQADDILIAAILGKDNQTITAPGGWTKFVEFNNTVNMRATLAWKRAVLADSGATFNFTKPTDNNILFCGMIAAFRGCTTAATPIDATTPSTSANASGDNVSYATFDPTEAAGHCVAVGFYNDDTTTAGTIAGTDPTLTNRWDLETNLGTDGSIFGYSGDHTGAATGARSHSTTSGVDAISIGVIFGLVPSAATTHNGSALYAATGSMASVASIIKSRSTAFDAVGTMATQATLIYNRSTAFNAVGSMSSVATGVFNRATAFSAVGSMVSVAAHIIPRTTLFEAAGTMASQASKIKSAVTAFTAAGAMASQAAIFKFRMALFSAVGSMVSAAAKIMARSTLFNAVGSLVTSATHIPGGTTYARSTAFAASGSLSTIATLILGYIPRTTTFAAVAVMSSRATLARSPTYDYPIRRQLWSDYGLRQSQRKLRGF